MIEALKQVNLVTLMSRCWQMRFKREGRSYVALSPFRKEKQPSFYVSQDGDGHWVYCDHGSGEGGTIIDAVMSRDGHSDVGLAIGTAQAMAEEAGLLPGRWGEAAQARSEPRQTQAKPDLEGLLGKLANHKIKPAREYLMGRGISAGVVDELIAARVILVNQFQESTYCCFAVRDSKGQLDALFNRKIKGPAVREKFLLGKQQPFCRDWKKLEQAGRVYICEAIIDALSVLTMQPEACVLAVPGAHYDLGRLSCLPSHATLVEAFDQDEAGRAAAERLRHHFPRHTIERMELQGAHDVNELLCLGNANQGETERAEVSDQDKQPRRSGNPDKPGRQGKLSLEDRLDIALSDKPSRELAAHYKVHHSRICAIRYDAAEILAGTWRERRPGRKANPVVSEDVEKMQREFSDMKHQLELLTMRKDWLELQVEIGEQRIEEAARTAKARKKKHSKRRQR